MQQTVNKCFGKYFTSAGQKRGAVSLTKKVKKVAGCCEVKKVAGCCEVNKVAGCCEVNKVAGCCGLLDVVR